jgi:hypothetical protein
MPPPPRHHGELRDIRWATYSRRSRLLTSKVTNNVFLDRSTLRRSERQAGRIVCVYVYKFDKHGRFKECKTWLVVSDQQTNTIHENTYASTLALLFYLLFGRLLKRRRDGLKGRRWSNTRRRRFKRKISKMIFAKNKRRPP